jgi:hypothetical protein
LYDTGEKGDSAASTSATAVTDEASAEEKTKATAESTEVKRGRGKRKPAEEEVIICMHVDVFNDICYMLIIVLFDCYL